MRHLALLALPLALSITAATAAGAALKKFQLTTIQIFETAVGSPAIQKFFDPEGAPFDTALLDDSTPGTPVLVKFRVRQDNTLTIIAPGLGEGAFIVISENNLEGPGSIDPKPSTFTGTGHTAAGSTITWGVVTGWSITGAVWCKGAPPVLCDLANRAHETTIDPEHPSDFYDMGTWTFHATGFTATPFIHRYSTVDFGNNQRWHRGFFIVDATVPALPFVGMALLGGGLVAGAVTTLRRRRDRR